MGTSNLENLKSWLKRGVNWIQGDADVMHLLNSGKKTYETIKRTHDELKH